LNYSDLDVTLIHCIVVLKAKKKTYDLNSQADAFYCKYASAIFPEAIEANEKELAEVSEKEMEIRSKPGLYDNGEYRDIYTVHVHVCIP
jgi:hypothetical protein